MKFNYKNVDESKTDLGIRHTYTPMVEWNIDCDDADRVTVECDYFKVGERVKYTTFSKDGAGGLDLTRVFKDKVKKINNLVINDKEINTAEKLLAYPTSVELEALMSDVVVHLIEADSLNKEETKN